MAAYLVANLEVTDAAGYGAYSREEARQKAARGTLLAIEGV